MFHKFALYFNSVILGISVLSYFFSNVLQVHHSFFEFILRLLIYVILFLIASFLIVFITSLITDVKVGKPPLGELVIAYKFGLSDNLMSSDVRTAYQLFETHEKVQICYERRLSSFGIAYGAIIQKNIEQVSDENKLLVQLHGFRLFQTKNVPNAVYIQCPAVPWLSYLGVWLILRIVYPKMYKYSKKHKLSAYPVVEIYRRFSVLLMAPLSQQDNFVVPEAQTSLHRSSSSLNVSSIAAANMSFSSHNSRSHSDNLSSVDEMDVTKLKQVPGPKVANGNAKRG